ncbi:hypothetical protein PVAP13_4KG146110 [Panicum virgatum]|uniref:Uncharacterized protein n=1 Tax=Panicum virgatum TaxID=38727 RepID=A0A8T0TQW5_PANVG|nr:hypothetical protein PVAP13_4KG146110 [Panicum virgatum]
MRESRGSARARYRRTPAGDGARQAAAALGVAPSGGLRRHPAHQGAGGPDDGGGGACAGARGSGAKATRPAGGGSACAGARGAVCGAKARRRRGTCQPAAACPFGQGAAAPGKPPLTASPACQFSTILTRQELARAHASRPTWARGYCSSFKK